MAFKVRNYVIIPTYKEAKNLLKLLPVLRKYHVIVVDDDSQDGTAAVCRRFSNVKLITRIGKRGMASASLDGMRSIADKNANIVFMDADLEHDPSKVKALFERLRSVDFVVAVKNGKRAFFRSSISWAGKKATHVILPDTKMLHDPMSCFFGLRISSIDKKMLQKIYVEPFGKLMIVIFESLKPASKVGEVTYTYGSRELGPSSFGTAPIMDYAKELFRLNDNRFLYFLIIGVLGIPLNEGLAALFYPYLPLAYVFLSAITISMIVNFVANHYITFRGRASFWRAFVKFLAITAVITGVTNFVVSLALSYFTFYLFANMFGIIAGFIVKYGLSETVIWKTPGQRHKADEIIR